MQTILHGFISDQGKYYTRCDVGDVGEDPNERTDMELKILFSVLCYVSYWLHMFLQ